MENVSVCPEIIPGVAPGEMLKLSISRVPLLSTPVIVISPLTFPDTGRIEPVAVGVGVD